MNKTQAIQRINDGLGFRADGNALEAKILLRLVEAQFDLERGKTLPRFLLQTGQTLTLVSGTHQTALPTGFIRESDDNLLHFFSSTSTKPIFLERKFYGDALGAVRQVVEDSLLPVQSVPPAVYAIHGGYVDFITTADQDYTLYWDYYKRANSLATEDTNVWLDEDSGAPYWLIGEAGLRIARSVRDADAVAEFDALRTAGRAACFGEDIAAELASGPLQMGANQ